MKLFISHASEDKRALVGPLVSELRQHGVGVWYDVEAMTLGDSLALAISDGLRSADAYLLVLSTHYVASGWCQREMLALIAESIARDKPVIVLTADRTEVPTILSDILRVELRRENVTAVAEKVHTALQRKNASQRPGRDEADVRAAEIVARILESEERRSYASNLLGVTHALTLPRPENEGLVLIKPGGTFCEPCLMEIFSRLVSSCRVRQVKLFDGTKVARLKLFDRLYGKQVAIARGELPLDEEDLEKIRHIYDKPAFERAFGAPFSVALLAPALRLCEETSVDPMTLTKAWEEGRSAELFHNTQPDGLNKIGYQKSVFPIELAVLEKPRVRLVLNGYLPGLRALFTHVEARLVAVHVSSSLDWAVVRNDVVGGESNPEECRTGSIRWDALHEKIPLDPGFVADRRREGLAPVDGQLNVCHASATQLDGMRELRDWFDYSAEQTTVGKLLLLAGVSESSMEALALGDVAEMSRTTRDESTSGIINELMLRQAVSELRTADAARGRRRAEFAKTAGMERAQTIALPGLDPFIENGLRLERRPEQLYLDIVAGCLQTATERNLFYEVAMSIRGLAEPRVGPAVLAEAYRIAAGDIRFVGRAGRGARRSDASVHEDAPAVASPQLFRASVLSELPVEALGCAQRTERNLIHAAQALRAERWDGEVLGDSVAWTALCAKAAKHVSVDGPTVGLVLAGGRSTRVSSTIPKAVLPLRGKLMFEHIERTLRHALPGVNVFAAIGFRADTITRALGPRVAYLFLPENYGVGFRVAASLRDLERHSGLVVLSYCDMPDISETVVRELADAVATSGPKTFGIVTTDRDDLSGCLLEEKGVFRVVQKRLRPEVPRALKPRDAGVYAFHNTPQFRDALLQIKNDNPRREFMFADVVEVLSRTGWKITTVPEKKERAVTVNTSSDFLYSTCRVEHQDFDADRARRALREGLGLEVPESWNGATLTSAIRDHFGPVHFFGWWEDRWT